MTRYSVPMAALPTVALQQESTTDPIGVVISSSGQDQVLPGNCFDINVTISNQGDKSAVIDIFLDELPVAIHPWCPLTQTQLALDPGEREDVTFHFDVPPNALTGSYHYWLVVDAPAHYPGKAPHRYQHHLNVLPPSQDSPQENTPTFAVEPVTTHLKPIKVLPGNPLQFQVYVYNRSDRVDRFRLFCPDLPEDWVTINYPQGFRTPGLAVVETQLDLNPDMEGVILLTLTPPVRALAQTMLVTLQVKSENNPKLKLLDVLYLQIEPFYEVTTHFRTLVSRIQQQSGLYSIQTTNQGNTERTLDFQVIGLEGGNLCEYTLRPDSLTLAPQQTLVSEVIVQPKNPWKQPLFGGGRVIQFEVIATDPDKKPLVENPMQGLLMWEARPWWQILPFILLLIGSFIGLMWLAWWLFIHPPAQAKVLRFATESSAYEAINGDTVSVGFEISHPGRIQQLEIMGQSAEGDLLSGPLIYDLSGKTLPPELESFCIERRQSLTCRNVRTDARRAGEYQFILNVIPKPGRNATPTQAQAPLVAIAPIPRPSILELVPSQMNYVEAPPVQPSDNQTAATAVSSNADTDEATSRSANESDSSDRKPLPSLEEDPYVVRVNWNISHPEQLMGLQLIVRDAQKAVALPPQIFNFQEGIPDELEDFCDINQNSILACSNVPTGLKQAGAHTIELGAIPKTTSSTEEPILATTDPIQVQARPPQVIQFTLNGDPILAEKADYLLPVDEGEGLMEIVLGWEVENNPGTQVMLMPAPGNVETQGTLFVPLSPDPGKNVFSLQVTNSAGESLTRSLTITTYDPTPENPTIIVNTGDGDQAADGASEGGGEAGQSSGPPVRSRPGTVSPVELPPQFE
ncbi:COG1470 family protein [Adonisia turfae]|uniref:Uncharacterized protein n=1 Tax=Adonisia turfae CCMR0081 TaxID=2292702 RepID=A0A6M0RPE3_9CYAN|nr:hypothetical protein [Adonisia turfae]NEZ57632.1 hypothetical protein [Adonisia turfae CCMR0081]